MLALAMFGAACSDGAVPAEPSAPATTSASSSTTEAPVVPSSTAPAAASSDAVALVETSLANALGDSPGGIDVLWRHDDVTTRVAVGNASADGTALAVDQPMRVGSISKSFVATMTMQLHDEGAVDIDAPLVDYLPDAGIADTITIRDLLGHRSGVPNYTDQSPFFAQVLGEPTVALTPRETLDFIAAIDPGVRGVFAYSNSNYVLLGLLIETIDQRPLAQSLRARIVEPLDLANTRFPEQTMPSPSGVAGGWSANIGFEGAAGADYTALVSSAWAAGALISSTGDLATFLDALFGGDLVSADSLAQMTDTGIEGYGLGLLRARIGDDPEAYGHNGLIPGFSSTMAYEVASGDMVVVLTNNDSVNADLAAASFLAG